MKKRFLSIILAVLVVMSAISIPTFAYSRYSEDINFNKFVATDWTTAGAKYGTLSYFGTSYPNVVTYSADEAKDRDGDGKSLKVEVDANSGKSDFPGAVYTPGQALTGKVNISSSHYIESHEKTSYIYRYITMAPVSGSEVTLASFTDSTSYMNFWNGTAMTGLQKITYPTDVWVDVDITYDLDTGYITHKVTSNGSILYNKSFTNSSDLYKDGIKEIRFYSQAPKWLSTKYANGTSNYANKEVMYLDNIKIKNAEAMNIAVADNVSDFNSQAPSDSMSYTVFGKPSNTPWSYAYANLSGGSGFNYVSTDRDVSLKFLRPTGATNNPQIRMNFDPFVSAVKSKVSIQVPDTNIAKPMYIVTNNNDTVTAVLFYDNGKLNMFGNPVCSYKINTWYDIEYSYNAQNGDYHYKVSDGEDVYTGSGVYTQSKGYHQTIQRVYFQLNKQNTYMLIDDFMLDTVATDFRLDKDLSTTDKTISKNETVYARFTKELNETPETLAEKVFEYYGNAEITSVSLLDKYTIKADFEKEMGKSYRIDFKNIAASDGSSTSDYIEFDVKKEDLEMTDVIFATSDGEIMSLIKPGKIKASFSTKTNNDKTFDFLYTLGLFSDGELAYVISKTVKATETKAEHSLELTVPSDGKVYVAKAFIWDAATLKPVVKPFLLKPTPDGKPVAIVKMDDLRADYDHYLDPFIDMIDWAEDNGIRVSTGLIASSLDTAGITDSQKAKLATINNYKNNEIWFHGYANDTTFSSDGNIEEQREDFQKGIAAAARYGITFKSFGPPSNNMRPITAQLIEDEFTNFTTVMALSTSGQAYSSHLNKCSDLFTHITVESGAAGNTDTVDNLKTMWNEKSTKKYILLQVHPAQWVSNEGSDERFKEFLLWLKSEGVVFMTPSEYTAYINTLN